MSLFQTLKIDALEARKARRTKTAAALTTLIGELETFSKNAGRDPTDADVVTFVKKTVKNIDETLKVISNKEDERAIDLEHEKVIFERYLPRQLDEAQLGTIIDLAISSGATSVGDVMKLLKTSYGGQYDGALASTILKQRFQK